jgi:hypothetical protein
MMAIELEVAHFHLTVYYNTTMTTITTTDFAPNLHWQPFSCHISRSEIPDSSIGWWKLLDFLMSESEVPFQNVLLGYCLRQV